MLNTKEKIYIEKVLKGYNDKYVKKYGANVRYRGLSEEEYEEHYKAVRGIVKGGKRDSVGEISKYIGQSNLVEIKGGVPNDDIQRLLGIYVEEFTLKYVDLSEYGIEKIKMDGYRQELKKLTSTELKVFNKLIGKIVNNGYLEFKKANREGFYKYDLSEGDVSNETLVKRYVDGVLRTNLGEPKYIKKDEVRNRYDKGQQLENFRKIYGYILKKLVKEMEKANYVVAGKRELAKLYLKEEVVSVIGKMESQADAKGALGEEVRAIIIGEMRAVAKGFTAEEKSIFQSVYKDYDKKLSKKLGVEKVPSLIKRIDITLIKDKSVFKDIEKFKVNVNEEVGKVFKEYYDSERIKVREEERETSLAKVLISKVLSSPKYRETEGIIYENVVNELSKLSNKPGIAINKDNKRKIVVVSYGDAIYGINGNCIFEGKTNRVIYDKVGGLQEEIGKSVRLSKDGLSLSKYLSEKIVPLIRKSNSTNVITKGVEDKQDQERLRRLIALLKDQKDNLKKQGIVNNVGKLANGEVNRVDIKVGGIKLMINPYFIYDYDNKEFIVKRDKSQSCLKEFEEQIALNGKKISEKVDKKALSGLFKMVTYAMDLRKPIK